MNFKIAQRVLKVFRVSSLIIRSRNRYLAFNSGSWRPWIFSGKGRIPFDNNIALEYTIPYNQSRLDCLLFGRNQESEDNIALIELKQWDSAEAIEATEDEGNFVETYTGGGFRVVP